MADQQYGGERTLDPETGLSGLAPLPPSVVTVIEQVLAEFVSISMSSWGKWKSQCLPDGRLERWIYTNTQSMKLGTARSQWIVVMMMERKGTEEKEKTQYKPAWKGH